MAADQTPQELLAVAFLVESSLEVAQEWRKKISEYSAALVKRLTDCHPNYKLKVGFVSYGPGDTSPSPIVCKRFFVDHQIFTKEMAESDLSRLGIGVTNSGGTRGMAALEGFVAVLELFDVLQSSNLSPSNIVTPTMSHVVHVAASFPDSSSSPIWNEQGALDSVTWDTLPLEIKKRNINLTSINLKHGLSRFSGLCGAVVTGGSSPWFNVYKPHAIFLAAFPTPPQTKVTPTKRAVDPPVDRVPENKRPRLQPSTPNNTDSPKSIPKSTPSQPPQQPNIAPVHHAQPPSRPAIPPLASQIPPNIIALLAKGQISREQFAEKLKELDKTVKFLHQQTAEAQNSGNKELAETLQKEYQIRAMALTNIVQNYQRLFNPQAAQGNVTQNQGYPHSLSTNSIPSTSSLPSMPQDVATNLNPPQQQHTRSLSDANFPMNPSNNNPMIGNSNLNSQMQKMIEQQQRGRPPHPTLGQGLMGTMMNNIGPSTGLPNRLNPGTASGQPPQQPDQRQQSSKHKAVWKGALNWSGTSTQGKKDMRAFVIAVQTNDNNCHQETWPMELSLAPVRETTLSESELTDWIRRHAGQVVLVTFIAPTNSEPTGRANGANFASLIALLTEKKIFATAAWTTPAGQQSRNALIFPMAGKLHGAFFPLTGLPPNLPAVPDLHSRFMQQMQSLPQDAQAAFLNKFNQARAAIAPQQQQASRSQDHNNPAGFAPNLLLAHNMMNMMNAQAQAQAQNGGMMNINGPQPSFPSSLPRSGMNNNPMNNNPVPNNVSLAMLQSFVQRNDGGTNLNPQG